MTRKQSPWAIGCGVSILMGILFIVIAALDSSHSAKNYSAVHVCNDAFEKTEDHRKELISHFDVKMQEGCFGGLVYLPNAWHNWHTQPVGDQKDYWASIWIPGEAAGRPPFFANADVENAVTGVVRTQGHGTIRFYSNDIIPPLDFTTSKPPFSAQQPDLSRLDYRNADSHICQKPDDAYYENSLPPGWGHDQYQHSEMKFLFDKKHHDNVISWANGFKGKVPLCFVVGASGTPTNVRFVQSPGPEIEEHLREYVSGWSYQPLMYKDTPLNIQLAFDFNFP